MVLEPVAPKCIGGVAATRDFHHPGPAERIQGIVGERALADIPRTLSELSSVEKRAKLIAPLSRGRRRSEGVLLAPVRQ